MKAARISKVLMLLMIVGLAMQTAFAVPPYYRKHVVVVVDQTPKTGGVNLMAIGNDMLQILQDNGFEFDSEVDCIEVFLYGLEGNMAVSPASGNAYRLNIDARNKPDSVLFKETIDYMVHPYKYATNFGPIGQWWDNEMGEVFSTDTPLANSIKENNGYGLSAFLPNVIIPFIDSKRPAQEYYIFCVSTFVSGQGKKSAHNDIIVLGQIYGNLNKANDFYDWILELSGGYVDKTILDKHQGNAQSNGVELIGHQLELASAQKTTGYITSNIQLRQASYKSKTFKVEPITVSFPKDDKLAIDTIALNIYNGTNRIYSSIVSDLAYNDLKKEYTLNIGEIIFPKEISDKDVLDLRLVFYPKSSNLLPYVFVASREVSDSAIVMVSPIDNSNILYIIIGAILLLVIILYFIWRWRGTKCTAEIDLNMGHVSNSRHMDVTNNRVINHDCWYFKPGEKEAVVQAYGSIETYYPSFAARPNLVAEFRVEDAGANDQFSFRPSGKAADNSYLKANQWYPLSLNNDGTFELEITAYFKSEVESPDFDHSEPIVPQMKLLVRTRFELNGKNVGKEEEEYRYYRFVVRPDIDNKDVWVALDPGTTGSCIAYGYGGLASDVNNISVALNHTVENGENCISPIFYSKIQIVNHSRLYDGVPAEHLVPFDSNTGQGDFRYGTEAHQIDARNKFQSIKKLLGYANEFEVVNDNGRKAQISGHDLAHLLVKGLCRGFEKYIETSPTVRPDVRAKILENGHLRRSRAIVAVPNNYTVSKIQAMVDTVKRTGIFEEVHYVYEAEGVMLHYLNLNWGELRDMQHKTFVVFDMGGATINATAFRINVKSGEANGSTYTRNITLDTISRVGYTVGGDNIDYALISIIVDSPSMKTAIEYNGYTKETFLQRYKNDLIKLATELKIAYIEKMSGHSGTDNMAENEEKFWTQLHKYAMQEFNFMRFPDRMEGDDETYFKSKGIHEVMEKQVFDSVREAMEEVVKDIDTTDVELIMSGRSVLYPGIRSRVNKVLESAGKKVHRWNYGKSHESKEIAVKTAVVRGACWYAMFSKYIELRHDKATSSFGYTDMIDGKVKFIPLVDKNARFDDDGTVTGEGKPKDPTINSVKFLQMLSSNFDKIYSTPELHKMAELALVPQSEINGEIKLIKVKVDSVGNFSYEINVAGRPMPISNTCAAIDPDISIANTEAYVFAAMATTAEPTDNRGGISLTKEGEESVGRRRRPRV